jgi:hypothetical protein
MGILLTFIFMEGARSVTFLNCNTGPCTDRKTFWDKVVSSGMLATKNLILAGDLNFTVSVGEVWGSKDCPDPLASISKEFLGIMV